MITWHMLRGAALRALGAAFIGAALFSCASSCGAVNGAAEEADAASAPAGALMEEADFEFSEIAVERLDAPPADLPVSEFEEIWGYLVDGDEAALARDTPVTDVGYFGAEVDSYGDLADVPRRSKIAWYKGRVHLVVASNGRGLTHFILDPESPARARLIAQLISAASPFDGLQIDFENIPARDGAHFLSFLRELRRGLPGKMLTAALKARTKPLADDVYDYEKIAPLVDRILIMAYDEHWSGSAPGPIASMAWCRDAARYAQGRIPGGKLIMGAPFYGALWGDERTFRWFFHSGIERIKREQGITEITRADSVPSFTYTAPVTFTSYYEDAVSLSRRLEMYRGMGITRIGFWRLGQEDPAVWSIIRQKP